MRSKIRDRNSCDNLSYEYTERNEAAVQGKLLRNQAIKLTYFLQCNEKVSPKRDQFPVRKSGANIKMPRNDLCGLVASDAAEAAALYCLSDLVCDVYDRSIDLW